MVREFQGSGRLIFQSLKKLSDMFIENDIDNLKIACKMFNLILEGMQEENPEHLQEKRNFLEKFEVPYFLPE